MEFNSVAIWIYTGLLMFSIGFTMSCNINLIYDSLEEERYPTHVYLYMECFYPWW